MSRMPGTGAQSNIPPPPPLPPPLRGVASGERLPKVQIQTQIRQQQQSNNKAAVKSAAASSTVKYGQPIPAKVLSKQQTSRTNEETRKPPPSPMRNSPTMEEEMDLELQRRSSPVIVRNDVPFFDEETCTNPRDQYAFPCCSPPNLSRYPANPRPQIEWDPSFLPSTTYVPTSIGRPCRRCGKRVHLAEMHLSSRGAFHTECFKCCLCGKTLDSWTMTEYKGEVFCKGCYRRNFGTHGCGFGVGAGVLQTP